MQNSLGTMINYAMTLMRLNGAPMSTPMKAKSISGNLLEILSRDYQDELKVNETLSLILVSN